jgi:preprotein translocase subunit SecG
LLLKSGNGGGGGGEAGAVSNTLFSAFKGNEKFLAGVFGRSIGAIEE